MEALKATKVGNNEGERHGGGNAVRERYAVQGAGKRKLDAGGRRLISGRPS